MCVADTSIVWLLFPHLHRLESLAKWLVSLGLRFFRYQLGTRNTHPQTGHEE